MRGGGRLWFAILALAAALAGLAVIVPVRLTRAQAPPAGPAQPIAFSHQLHAGQYRIDCQYCHAEARRSPYAGLPSVKRCLGCHAITAAGRPEIQKLVGYLQRGEPIPWVRLHKLAGFVYFSHQAHLEAGLTCQACHGAVETMAVAARLAPLTMGWCIECHARRQGPLDCVSCHH